MNGTTARAVGLLALCGGLGVGCDLVDGGDADDDRMVLELRQELNRLAARLDAEPPQAVASVSLFFAHPLDAEQHWSRKEGVGIERTGTRHGCIEAPIHLPHGATIRGFACRLKGAGMHPLRQPADSLHSDRLWVPGYHAR